VAHGLIVSPRLRRAVGPFGPKLAARRPTPDSAEIQI
jgi:hypothetical protein